MCLYSNNGNREVALVDAVAFHDLYFCCRRYRTKTGKQKRIYIYVHEVGVYTADNQMHMSVNDDLNSG